MAARRGVRPRVVGLSFHTQGEGGSFHLDHLRNTRGIRICVYIYIHIHTYMCTFQCAEGCTGLGCGVQGLGCGVSGGFAAVRWLRAVSVEHDV